MNELNWDQLIRLAYKVIQSRGLGEEYTSRLQFEEKEIDKQGANDYWVRLFNNKKKFDDNKNGLVLPWLLKMTPIDPVAGAPKIMIEGDGGKEMDAIEIKFDDGRKIVVSPDTLIEIEGNFVKASNLV